MILMISDIKFIVLRNGTKLLMVDGHTFAQRTPKHWYCSKKISRKCMAKVYFEMKGDNMIITCCDNKHNHAPTKYRKTKGGIYVRA